MLNFVIGLKKRWRDSRRDLPTEKKISGYMLLQRGDGSKATEMLVRFDGMMRARWVHERGLVNNYVPTTVTEIYLNLGEDVHFRMFPKMAKSLAKEET